MNAELLEGKRMRDSEETAAERDSEEHEESLAGDSTSYAGKL